MISSASLVCSTSQEQINGKTKKFKISPHDLNVRPSISLVWDGKGRSVVPKREQIGISRRQLMPYIDPSPHGHSILADVCSLPREIFEVENVSSILSYEVWQNYLSEKERSLLSEFLPKVAEPETIVRELLAGDNFHFGNPVQKWGCSLSSGDLHPDNVITKEQALKAGKKAYYNGLEKYHSTMIGNLHTLKEKWDHSKDPEVEVVQDMWRSRKHAQSSMPTSEDRACYPEENLAATPESCSWGNSDKAYSSDNQNSGMLHGELLKSKGFVNRTPDTSSSGAKEVARQRKVDTVQKRNIQHGNGSKYMSYVKISKEQHERVKNSMKNIGNSIKPKFLSNVIGSFDTLNVQPFERFEEEERTKLHQCWLKVATIDVPEGFANMRKHQSQIQQILLLLNTEMEQKLKHEEVAPDEEKGYSCEKSIEQSDDDGDETQLPTMVKAMEQENPNPLLVEQISNDDESMHDMTPEPETEDDEHHGICSDQDEKEIKNDYIYVEPTPIDPNTIEHEGVHSHVLVQDHIDQRTPIASSHDLLPSSSGDVWPGGDNVHGSYYHHHPTSTNSSYNNPPSGQDLLLPQFMHDQGVGIMDPGEDMLSRRRPQDPPFFASSFPTEDRNELLQSFYKGQNSNVMPYHNQPKHPGLELQPGNNLLMQATQFPRHLKEHHPHQVHDPSSLPMDQHNIPEAVYANPRYSMHHLSGADSSQAQNWFSSSAENNNVWPSSSSSYHSSFSNGNHNINSHNHNSSDQTLFSVLSECNELRPPIASYGSSMVHHTDPRLLNIGNYNGIVGGGAMMPSSSSGYLQPSVNNNPIGYFGGHEVSSGNNNNGKMNSNLGWIGMPQQNPESMGKQQPYLRSWNP